MTKIDIFSGFLGAGKTTLIKKLIEEAYKGEKIVLIENEFGEIGIDGGFLKEAGVEINEMNSGCICCSLVGDFGKALVQVMDEFTPDRILIEPSGVGKLSDVITAVKNVHDHRMVLNGFTTIVDAKKCKMYMKNFGEFFNNQIEHGSSIILSHTDGLSEEKLDDCVHLIRQHNQEASIITTPWDEIEGSKILEAIERKSTLEAELDNLEKEVHEHHDHHDHDHDENHEHHEHHKHEHHHHDHDEHCGCGCHDHDHDHDHHENHEHHEHHHHDHDEHCGCGCHDHDHDHDQDHHADEVFTSIGAETTHKYSAEKIQDMLHALENQEEYGMVLRAKGIVASLDGKWIHFDYVPGESDVRFGSAEVTGRLCVIGSKINEEKIKVLFEL